MLNSYLVCDLCSSDIISSAERQKGVNDVPLRTRRVLLAQTLYSDSALLVQQNIIEQQQSLLALN